MKEIRFAREKDGHLHADNANHPNITEADITEVLANPAHIVVHPKRKNRLFATAASSGMFDILTVVYHNGKALTAITAYPANRATRERYLELFNERGEGLWIPASDTE